MRYSKEVRNATKIPENVKLLKWLPQNDLLGHYKVKLFITHGGANGQFEALYHGVPMIVFPLYGDQPYNAKRGEYKGFSVTMDILTFEPDELRHNIQLLLSDDRYKLHIQKASRIFTSRAMNPRKRAVFWIEHVLEFGGAHLRSHGLDMPWYQYFMLDIVAVFLGVLVLIAVAISAIVWCILRKICRPHATIKIKTN